MINNIYYLEAASQNPVGCQYIKKQFLDFHAGRRTNDGGQMSGIVIEVDIVHIDDVAAYFAQLPAPVARLQQLPSQRGKTLFFKGREGLVACAECHGLQAQSQSLSPWLDAQHGAYLVKQLQDLSMDAETTIQTRSCGRSPQS
ncbi:hypothetical protein C2W62_09020 [Candidatus Entotheonella serta]|nr:hypothetical protein C2W62_09020 [Candidatus Entotheonella serta]